MAELPIAARFKHPVRGKKSEDTAESLSVGTRQRRQAGGCAGRLFQMVCNAQIRDDMQCP